MRDVKIGAVSFINTLPLTYGIETNAIQARGITLSSLTPSRCADALKSRRIDLGLVPYIESLRNDYKAVPGMSLSTYGEVLSVVLLVRNEKIRRLLVDVRSRTSVCLSIIVAREIFHTDPQVSEYDPQKPYPDTWDARLLIGDDALFLSRDNQDTFKIYDLGKMWCEITGLPFTFALWSSHDQEVIEYCTPILTASKEYGITHLKEIAKNLAKTEEQHNLIFKYLSVHMAYDLGDREWLGLAEFERKLKVHGLL